MPESPQWTILDPIASRIGFASSKSTFEPPTINVKVPSLAAFTPVMKNYFEREFANNE